ncbi:CDP-glycerol glycerophosphotransferase (TagB/SpsB family) [Natranaerovirga pectinivora]|uniref:CDP-glycerol glycerophosphotransferase (TagB/SpsB family) n=1 Tax=Natranaerovirga pectinivora TaxID=682400 RepID=A0A4R3MJ96_9FIRM|nr:CDP-glycerol glycerophosphotransferase family protein [Natranaerovirga pectinivora]TCT14029.1 CDP-glycerol glycerophosphotransferase (TagB/SpsB family) [Natranaerovirga pectinivora]
MKRIIVFGTGSSAEKLLSSLDYSQVQISFFVDNNEKNQYMKFRGYDIFHPKEIIKAKYDYIIIASQYSVEIMQQLLNYNISFNKIIPSDSYTHNNDIKSMQDEIYKGITIHDEVNNNKLKIALINYNYSNYNGYSLFRKLPKYIQNKYEIDLIEIQDKEKLMEYDVICSSHYDGIYDRKHINLELWHGFPLKQMGNMHYETNQESLNYYRNRSDNTNLIFSYSQLYSTFFNACFSNSGDKYRITGMPRNDLLFEKGSLVKLEKICQRTLMDTNIVFFLPTWKKGKNKKIESNREWSKLFGFSNENEENIVKMLERNNLFLLVKLHPYEYDVYKDMDIFKHDRVFLLSEEHLIQNRIHLYELLNCGKMLITDYSSIYFDTLLVDMPIIFTPFDINEYSKKRGFLIEPYDFFTPGPKVEKLEELEEEIARYISGKDQYKDKRERIKNIVFKYTDNKASLRVWKEIDKYLSKNRT